MSDTRPPVHPEYRTSDKKKPKKPFEFAYYRAWDDAHDVGRSCVTFPTNGDKGSNDFVVLDAVEFGQVCVFFFPLFS